MTTIYKLTNQKMRTGNESQWALGETKTAKGTGPLCSRGHLHAYTDPLLAVALNPIYADIDNPRLFVGDGEISATDHGLRIGCSEITLKEEIPVPVISTNALVRWGILVTLAIPGRTPIETWDLWAHRWLAGESRTHAAAEAEAARAALLAAAEAAAEAAAAAAARAGAGTDIDLMGLLRRAIAEEI